MSNVPAANIEVNTSTITVTVPTSVIVAGLIGIAMIATLFIRFFVNTRYSRLPAAVSLPNQNEAPYDLRIPLLDEGVSPTDHADPVDVLRSVKAFGYLDRSVLNELARHMEIKRVRAGHVIQRSEDADLSEADGSNRSFCVVLDGTVGVFVKHPHNQHGHTHSNSNHSSNSASHNMASSAYAHLNGVDSGGSDSDNEASPFDVLKGHSRLSLSGYHLLSQVSRGGLISSLFGVLDILTDAITNQDEIVPESHRPSEAAPIPQPSRSSNVPPLDGVRAPSNETPTLNRKNIHAESEDTAKTYATPPPITIPETTSPTISQRQKLSQHPHITSLAITDSKLLFLPAHAFRKIHTKNFRPPSIASSPLRRSSVSNSQSQQHLSTSAHVAQILVTRFLRVTVFSMEKYLGLRGELLNLERGLCASSVGFEPLLEASSLERLRKRCAEALKYSAASSSMAAASLKAPAGTEKGKEMLMTQEPLQENIGGLSDAGLASRSAAKPKTSPQLHPFEMVNALHSNNAGLRKRHVTKAVLEVDGSESDSSAIGYPPVRPMLPPPPSHASSSLAGGVSDSTNGPPLGKRNTIMGFAPEQVSRLVSRAVGMGITSPAGRSSATGTPSSSLRQYLSSEKPPRPGGSLRQEPSHLSRMAYNESKHVSAAERYHASGAPGIVLEPESDEDHGVVETVWGAIARSLGLFATSTNISANGAMFSPAPRGPIDVSRRSSVDSLDSATDDGFDNVSMASSQASSSEYLIGAAAALKGKLGFIAGGSGGISLSGTSVSSGMKDLLIIGLQRGTVLCKEGDRGQGMWFVIDGILEASVKDPSKARKKGVFLMKPGCLAGYLSAVTGHPSLVTIKAKTDAQVGYLPKSVVEKYVERYPTVILTLAKRLVRDISPLAYQIDFALDWGHVNAGQVLYRQGDQSDSIFIVLGGRLRSIAEPTESSNGETNEHVHSDYPYGASGEEHQKFEIFGEFGPGESIGELEVLMESKRPTTIHAIRDTEVAIMPKTLFNALAIRHPEMTIQISRMLAARSQGVPALPYSSNFNFNPFGDVNKDIAGSQADSGNPALMYPGDGHAGRIGGAGSAANNFNLKTVGIIPVNSMVPIAAFSDRLKGALELIGASVALLNNSSVIGTMGKHVFSPIGRLKLMSWLAEQEDTHRLVLYVADGGISSHWTQRCIRQADCILLVGLGDEDPAIGEYERLVLSLKTTARKELILLHNERQCVPGSTAQWLKSRLWIHAHHHVQMPLSAPKILNPTNRKNTLMDLQAHFQRFYSQATGRLLHPNARNSPNAHTGIRSDFARIARRLLNKSIGLALGGGGARGISHIAIIRAFEEAGIPIDMVGGTSIGSFVSGLYARENDHVSIYGRAKQLSSQMSSKWRQFLDITYPLTSLFTGHELNRAVWKCFFETQIEDCWLPYFAVTVNITDSRIEVHRSGYMWRYVRASMSLAGYFPPLCDNGKMLVDGGYLNILPVDILSNLGANIAIAIDVSAGNDTSAVTYGDSLSGVWLFFARFIPGLATSFYGKIPLLPDIQDRLAFAGSVGRLERARLGEFYLQPPVSNFGAVEFDKFQEVYQIGYKYGREIVKKWERDGTLERRFGVIKGKSQGRRGNRRASI
ncbi:phosphatidylcholine and lysophosphatidylcholine phospholipase [Chytriomyces hyalinus]|nr:phosphatidylcholine and lysophosphatidylcholine phospholipase [Chytriomyces hyalinus]